jgi:hypothetical protein
MNPFFIFAHRSLRLLEGHYDWSGVRVRACVVASLTFLLIAP